MATGGFKEAKDRTAELHDDHPEAFEMLCNYLYLRTGNLQERMCPPRQHLDFKGLHKYYCRNCIKIARPNPKLRTVFPYCRQQCKQDMISSSQGMRHYCAQCSGLISTGLVKDTDMKNLLCDICTSIDDVELKAAGTAEMSALAKILPINLDDVPMEVNIMVESILRSTSVSITPQDSLRAYVRLYALAEKYLASEVKVFCWSKVFKELTHLRGKKGKDKALLEDLIPLIYRSTVSNKSNGNVKAEPMHSLLVSYVAAEAGRLLESPLFRKMLREVEDEVSADVLAAVAKKLPRSV